MRYCRFERDGQPVYGVIDGDAVRALSGDLFGEHEPEGPEIPLESVRLLAPVIPRKVLAAAVNYQSHVPSGSAVLKDGEAPSVPQLFLKPSSSVIGPGDKIMIPASARRVDAEGEMVAVVGRVCRRVTAGDALSYVLGYTCGNDLSERYWQRDDIQWWRAKGSDTFTAIGPVITTGLNPAEMRLRTLVNGEVKQEGTTADLIHSLAEIISFASEVMTLEPGDLVFTGTPGVPPRIDGGDVVRVEIDEIGVLENPVGSGS